MGYMVSSPYARQAHVIVVKGRGTINNINEQARPLGYRPARHLSNYLYMYEYTLHFGWPEIQDPL